MKINTNSIIISFVLSIIISVIVLLGCYISIHLGIFMLIVPPLTMVCICMLLFNNTKLSNKAVIPLAFMFFLVYSIALGAFLSQPQYNRGSPIVRSMMDGIILISLPAVQGIIISVIWYFIYKKRVKRDGNGKRKTERQGDVSRPLKK